MAKKHYYPSSLAEQMVHLNHFSEVLPVYQVELRLSAADLQQAVDDAAYFEYAYMYADSIRSYSEGLTAYKSTLLDGDPAAALSALPAPPVLPVSPTLVNSGVKARHFRMVRRIKTASGYTPQIGLALGIVGIENVVDWERLKPYLKVVLVAGKPRILWQKGPAFALEIYFDRGNGSGYGQPSVTSKPPFFDDKHPLPPLGTSAIWNYKAVYRNNRDERIGKWSSEIEVLVAGVM